MCIYIYLHTCRALEPLDTRGPRKLQSSYRNGPCIAEIGQEIATSVVTQACRRLLFFMPAELSKQAGWRWRESRRFCNTQRPVPLGYGSKLSHHGRFESLFPFTGSFWVHMFTSISIIPTVDGQHPAPVGRWFTSVFVDAQPSELVRSGRCPSTVCVANMVCKKPMTCLPR